VIALDTNILVRLLTADDAAQARRAKDLLLQSRDYWIPVTVLLELGWVLQSQGWERARVAQTLRELLSTANIKPQHPDAVYRALQWHRDGVDLADALHVALSATASEFLSFDEALQKKAAALGLSPAVATPAR